VAKNAKMVHVPYSRSIEFNIESFIFAMVSIANDLEGKGKNTAVVNMSLEAKSTSNNFGHILYQVLRKSNHILRTNIRRIPSRPTILAFPQ
jgi:hypothetical protein